MCQIHIAPTYRVIANTGLAIGPSLRSSRSSGRATGRSRTLREAEDAEDRRDVEQQDVLDHVHEEQVLAERVDGGEERDHREGDAGEEQHEASDGRVARAPPAHVDERQAGQHDERAEAEGPGCVRGGCGRGQGRCRHARGLSQGVTHVQRALRQRVLHVARPARPPRPAALRGVPVPLPRAGDVVCAGCRRALPWLRGPQCAALRAAAHGERRVPGRAPGVRRRLGGGRLRRRGARPRGRAEVPPRARPLADVMAAQLAAGAPRSLLAGATIVPVPAHPAHVRGRGFDQARLLAGALARRTDARLARPLRRRGPVRSQLGASRAERLRAGADRRLRPWPGPGPGGAGRRRAHDGRDARRVRPSAASGGGRRGRRADLGARSPGRIPVRPRQVVR